MTQELRSTYRVMERLDGGDIAIVRRLTPTVNGTLEDSEFRLLPVRHEPELWALISVETGEFCGCVTQDEIESGLCAS